MIDVGVVCLGTARYVGKGAATVSGAAAAVYEGAKMEKYRDQPNRTPLGVPRHGQTQPSWPRRVSVRPCGPSYGL